jgi:hypothetical protein
VREQECGGAAGVADALFPLDGVVAPTFSAYEIAASFLLPFVAIRAVAGDRISGALNLTSPTGRDFFDFRASDRDKRLILQS